MRSTVTLATYFETIYPNAVLSVRLGQDLRSLDKLVEQRLTATTLLERSLSSNFYNNTRPTVRVGNMQENVDAIKYYTHVLDDLNEAVKKEQESAHRLAMNVDRLSGTTAINVIEEFLRVTEIGSIKRMLKERSGNPDKWMLRNRSPSSSNIFTNGNNYNSITSNSEKRSNSISSKNGLPLGVLASGTGSSSGIEAIEENDVCDERKRIDSKMASASGKKTFNVYKTTWSEWLWTMWTAPSLLDCWRAFKEGRHAEDHQVTGHPDEETSLISPPEVRRLFLSKAFVTFKTFTAATIARQVVHMQLVGHMAVSEAPEPTDMMWTNLYSTRTGTMWRRFFVESVVLVLIIAWVAPVTLLSSVVSEEALRRYSPLIDKWCETSELFDSMVELVQPAALVAIMNLLPPILTALAVLEGCISFSSNQFRSFDRYFTFQVINVFLVTTIAGSVIDCVEDIYLAPSSAFELLGTSLPKMGGYFTNYIIMKAFIGLGMEIMRFPALCSAIVKMAFTSNLTPRDRKAQPLFGSIRATHNPGWLPFSKIYAQDVLLFVLCATYACISPLILAAGLCYFGGASYVYKHQMLFVYEPIYETGGRWWPKIARCIVVALLFAQCTMVGMMILKETYTEIYFLALIIVSTSFYYWMVAATYEPLAAQVSLFYLF